MSQEKSTFQINLLGTSIDIRSDSSEEYLQKVLTHLRHKVEVIKEHIGIKDSLKIAILAGFLLVDDLMNERSERANLPTLSHQEAQDIEKITLELLDNLKEIAI